MYRARYHAFVQDPEEAAQLTTILGQYNKLAADRGWAQGTFWTHVVGEANEVIGEFDFPDLVAFEKEFQESLNDEELDELFKGHPEARTPFDLLATVPA